MGQHEFRIGAYSTLYPTDFGQLVEPSDNVRSSSRRILIGCHGRGATAIQGIIPPLQVYVDALREAGIASLWVDHARINSWGDPDAMRALDDAYAYVQALGYTATKIGFMGWSMGGLTALNWIKRNAAKVSCAWLWNPATDLRFWHDASYTPSPSYPLSGIASGAYTSEIESTYAPSTTANGAQTINGSGGAAVTLNVATNGAKGFADGHNNGVVGLPRARVNAAVFTYTGKTDSTLTGCKAVNATPIVVTNGQAVTGDTSAIPYTTQSNGYRVQDEPASWNGLGVKIKVCQASDDTTVPPGMNSDATGGFVARVGDANVTLRSPAPTGGHTLSISPSQVPLSEVVRFYLDNLT